MESSTDHVTPYDRFALTDLQVEPLLLSGAQARELATFFGPQEYAELVQLARLAHAKPPAADAPTVLIVPGIMGSQLGIRRHAPLPHDVLWLDPVDIGNGRLAMLRLASHAASASSTHGRLCSLGPVLHSHLKLKLRLRAAGFAPELHHYDWRVSIESTARELASRIEAYGEPPHVIAHSMGGLLARRALGLLQRQPPRTIMLGTPQLGSFAAVQALRGTYAVVRKVARLDHRHDAERLAHEVFSSFPSLYEMLPAAPQACGVDLFDPSAWPRHGPQPVSELLARARSFQQTLPPPDERMMVIIGTGQETVTDVELCDDGFRYTISRRGDGTVPMACAELPGARNYYTRTAHSELTRDPAVAGVLIELLRAGRTARLPTRRRTRARAIARITDAELRRTHTDKVDWSRLTPEQRRDYLQNLNEPPRLQLRIRA